MMALYVIWSEEHGAWWGRDETNFNYTRSLRMARRYPKDEADKIVFDASCFLEVGVINEVALPDPWPEDVPRARSRVVQGEAR